jgi:hypothetical protein
VVKDGASVKEREQEEELWGPRYPERSAEEREPGDGEPARVFSMRRRKSDPAQSDKINRDKYFQEWAWVDSDLRPHAYQAPVK